MNEPIDEDKKDQKSDTKEEKKSAKTPPKPAKKAVSGLSRITKPAKRARHIKLGLAILAIGVLGWFILGQTDLGGGIGQRAKVRQLIADGASRDEIIGEVLRIELGSETVAPFTHRIIQDVSILTDKTLYADAEEGHLIVQSNDGVFLYDPENHVVINKRLTEKEVAPEATPAEPATSFAPAVEPGETDQATPTPSPAPTSLPTPTPTPTPAAPETLTVDVLNGSTVTGAAGAMAARIDALAGFESGVVANAVGNYEKTVIVNPNNYPISALRSEIENVKIETSVPDGEAITGDILVIVGAEEN